MFNQIVRYYHTLRFLQWVQIKYRAIYFFKNRFFPARNSIVSHHSKPQTYSLSLIHFVQHPTSWFGDDRFCFLNIQHQFEKGIDWSYASHGKLWTYNLCYFDFLHQANLSKYEGLGLMRDFLEKQTIHKDAFEPYPISLRSINWIKFFIKHNIQSDQLNQSLHGQITWLSRNLEYHILGNHLLENAFALLFGACFFKDDDWFRRADNLLRIQLEEQILEDGAHFELSPMYHQIILYRLLDAIQLLDQSTDKLSVDLNQFLKSKATLMLGWLKVMQFKNGTVAKLNDSTEGIAPTIQQLYNYGDEMGLFYKASVLSQCGYRKIETPVYELLIDVGKVGPDYIPGHAHSDTGNFVLQHQQKPVIVDVGISTYEKNDIRQLERSTQSHNTVMVEGIQQTEVWGGFRVARRANIIMLKETNDHLLLEHDGYKEIGVVHQRSFKFIEKGFLIQDEIGEGRKGKAFLHFDRSRSVQLEQNRIIGAFGEIEFSNATHIELKPFEQALGFNNKIKSTKVIISFCNQLKTKFTLL